MNTRDARSYYAEAESLAAEQLRRETAAQTVPNGQVEALYWRLLSERLAVALYAACAERGVAA
jgi:hypothetical protein